MQQIMAEEFEIAIQSQFQKTGSISTQPIFGKDFKVQDMSRPTQYLPVYQQAQNRERSFVQDCNSCCGSMCICLAYPFALCCCKCCCVYELSTSITGIVEEFGKFNRLMNPGFNMINPCTEQVRQVDMKIRILTPSPNYCMTKDNVKVTITSCIAYRVINPIQVFYVLGAQLNHALVQSTNSAIRTVAGESILDEILTNRSKITQKIRTLIFSNIPAGVFVESIFIQDIIIPKETMIALSSTAKQKRVSQANIINNKADVQSAGLLKQAAQLLDTKAAMQIRYLQMVTDLGKKGAKLLMPIGVNKQGVKQ